METEPKGPSPGRETLICDADLVQAGFYPAEPRKTASPSAGSGRGPPPRSSCRRWGAGWR
ncbi:hypothetical protein ACFQU7_00030 [Pseudoroseomonas wenyumeiae]